MKIINLLCILAIIFTTACSTTGKRTPQYPPQINNYPPEEQNLIRSGKIAVGFDESQVRMAWGKPSRVRTDSVSSRYYWEYQHEVRQTIFGQFVDALANPFGVPRQSTSHGKLTKRVVFDASTQRVHSYRSFY